jgi:hypothetical protein
MTKEYLILLLPFKPMPDVLINIIIKKNPISQQQGKKIKSVNTNGTEPYERC